MRRMVRQDFPTDFTFGTATSSYQIEGHSFGNAGQTHWDSFAATPGNVVRAEDGAVACDHYHRYEEDLDLVAAAGFDAYRFSTSWARIMPGGTGPANPEGLDFYDRLVDATLDRGLKPFATLYHWELPSPIADRGGWANRDIADHFADFTQTVMKRIGDRVATAAPINEPWCIGWLGYMEGGHAPGTRNVRAAARAMHHILLAHGKAIGAMRALGMDGLGGVFNLEWAEPADATPGAAAAAARWDAAYNRFFLEGIFRGRYPDEMLDGFGAFLPDGYEKDFEIITAPLDWVGINYYTRKLLRAADGPWPSLEAVEGPLPKTQMGWEIFPDGLYGFLKRVSDDYSGDLPIYVTENGMASADRIVDGAVADEERMAYLDSHLEAVRRAIADGVPVNGYFVWSLLDNYEWSFGYEKRFGLVHVDFDTQKRTPKASWHALRTALTAQ